MSETRRIAGQLRRSLTGPAWHGPSLLEILSDVSADEASARPLAAAHSIGELVTHVTAWINEAHDRLDGPVVELHGEADWPPPRDWKDDVAALSQSASRLASRIEAMADDDLKLKLRSAGQEYPRYVLLHGVIQHNLYHAGQMALLKKALRGS
jgi:uncharacterized damage-inducible protein DinB